MPASSLSRLALALAISMMPLGAAFAQGAMGIGGDEPVEIESDKLEVMDRQSTAIFTGNVTLVQGDLLLRTVKLTVYYTQPAPAATASTAPDAGQNAGSVIPAQTGGGPASAGTEVERMIAEGKVYLDKGGQVVTGDRGEFEMKKGTMVVTGNEVVLTEGPNVVVGCRFTMNSNTGRSQVDACRDSAGKGRVRMLLQPGSSQP